jgi:NAD(P)-dependent dehydrogenase (short-subunit alcohol dehydrogenase family)
MTRLLDKSAIVTGGGSGFGEGIVRKFAAEGAKVLIADRDEGNARRVAEATGAQWLRCDVTIAADVKAMIDTAHERFGGLDILVNNAGIGAIGTVEDNPDEQWHQVLDVNVLGIVRTSRAALPHLRNSDHAAIVNTCSIGATAGLPQRALYCASKGAVLSLTLAMAADHVREGIRVNCVNPGTADTPWVGRLLDAADDPDAERTALNARQPMGRLVAPDEVAAAIAYLASPAAASVTGTSLAVDGGMQGLRLRPAAS